MAVRRDGNQSGSRRRRKPASQGHPSRGGTTVGGGTKTKPTPYRSPTPAPSAPKPDITLGGDRRAARVTGHETKAQRIEANRRKRRTALRQLNELLNRPVGIPSPAAARALDLDIPTGIPSPAAARALGREQERTTRDLDRLFSPESKVKRGKRTEAAERLGSQGLVTLPSTVARQARQANKYRLRKDDDRGLLGDVGHAISGAAKAVVGAHTPLGQAERDAAGSQNQTLRALRNAVDDPSKVAKSVTKALALASALRGGNTRDLKTAGVDPEDAAKYLDVPIHVARGLATSGKARRRTVESVPGLLAGLIPGTVAAVADPAEAVEALKADLKERYGKGRYEDVLKGMERHGGLPYLLDIGGATSIVGRAATPAARIAARTRAARAGRDARENLIDRPRPDLQIAPGVRRGQATSQNLVELLGQRGLDAARRRRAERRASNPDPEARRGIQPDDDAVPALTIRGQDRLLTRHQEGRHGRNTIEYRTLLKHVLSRHRKELARLSKQERKGFADALELGLPAGPSRDAVEAGQAILADRMNQIEATRRAKGTKLSRADRDELKHLADLHRNYAETFTPELRAVADDARRTAKRVGLSDPGLVDEQVLRRTLEPQARTLGIEQDDRVALLAEARHEAELELNAAKGELDQARRAEAHAEGRAGAQATGGRRVVQRGVRTPPGKVVDREGPITIHEGDHGGYIIFDSRSGRSESFKYKSWTREQLRAMAGAESRGDGQRADLTKLQGERLIRAQTERIAAERRVASAQARLKLNADELIGPAEPIREWVARVEEARKARGLGPAGYFPHTPHRHSRSFSSLTGGSGLRAVAGPKATRYRLFDEGRVSRDPLRFEDAIARAAKRSFNWRSVADAMDAYAYTSGKTLREVSEYMRDHDLSPDDVVAVNPVKFRASFKARDDGDLEYGDSSLREAWTASRINGSDERALDDPYAEDASWALIPKAISDAVEQGRTQFGEGKLARMGGKLWKSWPSKLILGTNPSWAVFQVLNDSYMAALAGINPATLIRSERYFRGQLRPGVKSKGHERRMETAAPYAGAAPFSRELYGTKMGSQAGRLGELSDGIHGFIRSHWFTRPLDRMGNPLDALFKFDAAKANIFRRAVLYDDLRRKAYRDMGSDVRGWMRAANQLDDFANALNAGPVDGIDALLRNRGALEQAGEHVDRALGNFTKFGPKERRFLERNIMFYGFLRFSLRFTFLTLPRDHPIIASLQAHFSQLHEDEVRKLLGVKPGDPLAPGLLAKYYLEEGGKLLEVPLGRANPALNALTTAGSLGDVPQALVTTLPPIAQELLAQAFEEAPFTGKDWLVSGETIPRQSILNREPYTLGQRGRIFLNDLLSVMAPYRTLRELRAGHAPQSLDSFAWDPTLTEYSNPDIATDVELQRRHDLQRPRADVIRDSLLVPLVPRESREPDRQRRYLEDLGRIKTGPLDAAIERANKFADPEYLDLWIDKRLEQDQRQLDRKLSKYGLR